MLLTNQSSGWMSMNNIQEQVLDAIHKLRKKNYYPSIVYMIPNDSIPENTLFYGVQVRYTYPLRNENGDLVVLLFKCDGE